MLRFPEEVIAVVLGIGVSARLLGRCVRRLTKFTIRDSDVGDLSPSNAEGAKNKKAKTWIVTTPKMIKVFLGGKLQSK